MISPWAARGARGGGGGPGRGGGGSGRCFAPASPDSACPGAVRSSAQASRCRATGRCASQQLTVQNTSPVRFWLQVETLHTQYVARSAIGFLQELQRRQ